MVGSGDERISGACSSLSGGLSHDVSVGQADDFAQDAAGITAFYDRAQITATEATAAPPAVPPTRFSKPVPAGEPVAPASRAGIIARWT